MTLLCLMIKIYFLYVVVGHKILDNFISTESGMGLESRETQIVRFRDHTKAAHEVLVHCLGEYTTADDDNQEPIIGELRMKLNCKDSAKEYLFDNEAATIACEEHWFNTSDLVEYSNKSHKLWGKLNMNQIFHKGSIIGTVEIQKKIFNKLFKGDLQEILQEASKVACKTT